MRFPPARGAVRGGDIAFQFSLHEILRTKGTTTITEQLNSAFNSLFMRFPRVSLPRAGRRRSFNSLFMRFMSAILGALLGAGASFQFSLHEIPREGAEAPPGQGEGFQFSLHEIPRTYTRPSTSSSRCWSFQFSLHEIHKHLLTFFTTT